MEFRGDVNIVDRPIFVNQTVEYHDSQRGALKHAVRVEQTGTGHRFGREIFVWTIVLER